MYFFMKLSVNTRYMQWDICQLKWDLSILEKNYRFKIEPRCGMLCVDLIRPSDDI